MITSNDGRTQISGNLVEIMNDFCGCTKGIYKMLVKEFGDKADDLMVLLGRYALADKESKDEHGEEIAKTVMQWSMNKFIEELNDGKEIN